MKVTITPTGEISMETNGSTPAEVAGVILSVQRELREQQRATERRTVRAPLDLNSVHAELWDWLVDNDGERGIHVQAVADRFHITPELASTRCQALLTEGHAVRVSRGRYRAVAG